MNVIPNEILREFFKHVDSRRVCGRATLKGCRLVCRRFCQVVHPYAFRVLKISGAETAKETPFQDILAKIMDPKHQPMVECVEEMIITGSGCSEEPEDLATANWRSTLDWCTLCALVRPCIKLKNLSMYSIRWIPTPFDVQSEEAQVGLLSTWTSNQLHITLHDFHPDFTAVYHPFPFPPMLLSPQTTRLTICNTDILHQGLTGEHQIPLWRCSDVNIMDPSPTLMKILEKVHGLTRLSFQDIRGNAYRSRINKILERNKESLCEFSMTIMLDLWGASWCYSSPLPISPIH